MSYIVVFEGTGKENSNWKGVRVMVDYRTQKEFEKFKPNNHDLIIAEGVDLEEAQRLVGETPLRAYFEAAIEQSYKTGEFSFPIFKMAIMNALSTDQRNGPRIAFLVFEGIEWTVEGAGTMSPSKEHLYQIVKESFPKKDWFNPLVFNLQLLLCHEQLLQGQEEPLILRTKPPKESGGIVGRVGTIIAAARKRLAKN